MKQKTFFGLYASVVDNEFYGAIAPNKVDTILMKAKNLNFNNAYSSFPTDHINRTFINKWGKGRFNQRAEPTYINHFQYLMATFWNLPRILKNDAVLFITPPFFNCIIIPILKFWKKEIYIVSMDAQIELARSYKPGFLKSIFLNIADWQEKRAIKKATKVFAVSKYLEKKYKKLNKKTYLIPNGADVKHIGSIPKKRKFKEFTITYLGGFENYRGVDMLIDAFNDLNIKDAKLLLIGDGPERKNLEKRASGNPNITFEGYIPHDTAISYVKGSDIVVMPSRKTVQSETISSIKCFEYIACEVPAIVTDTGDHAHWMSECGAGIVVEDTSASIKEGIELIANNKDIQTKLRTAAKKNKKTIDYTVFKKVFQKEVE